MNIHFFKLNIRVRFWFNTCTFTVTETRLWLKNQAEGLRHQ